MDLEDVGRQHRDLYRVPIGLPKMWDFPPKMWDFKNALIPIYDT